MNNPLVSIVLPVMIMSDEQKTMTDRCISTMRTTTNVPYELIVVEAKSKVCEEYLNFPEGNPLKCQKYLIRYRASVSIVNASVGVCEPFD